MAGRALAANEARDAALAESTLPFYHKLLFFLNGSALNNCDPVGRVGCYRKSFFGCPFFRPR